MKKLFLTFIAALCCTVMAKAEIAYNVPYIDENGAEQICDSATVVTITGETTTWTAGWYVLNSKIIARDQRLNIVCKGDVHLILKDNTLLEIHGQDWHAGIEVSGEGNSLTIYGQKEQTGRLVARSGGPWGAGIGGSGEGNGTNITINGGIVDAYAENNVAGIGGSLSGYGSNIIINGGSVFATGGSCAIGSGTSGKPASDIFLSDRVKAMIGNTGIYLQQRRLVEHSSIEDDIAGDIAGAHYFVSIDFTPFFAVLDKEAGDVKDDVLLQFVKTEKQKMVESPRVITYDEAVAARDLAKAKIKAVKELVQYLPDDENIRKDEYVYYIFSTFGSLEKEGQIESQKNIALGRLQGLEAGYNSGNASALGTLGTKQDGPALIVTDKDGKEITLYSPKSVEYIKVKEEE